MLRLGTACSNLCSNSPDASHRGERFLLARGHGHQACAFLGNPTPLWHFRYDLLEGRLPAPRKKQNQSEKTSKMSKVIRLRQPCSPIPHFMAQRPKECEHQLFCLPSAGICACPSFASLRHLRKHRLATGRRTSRQELVLGSLDFCSCCADLVFEPPCMLLVLIHIAEAESSLAGFWLQPLLKCRCRTVSCTRRCKRM